MASIVLTGPDQMSGIQFKADRLYREGMTLSPKQKQAQFHLHYLSYIHTLDLL